MTVDIIIPTYKPDETLCLLLQKLQGQTFVVHRVIIMNTEEALWTDAVAKYPIEKAIEDLPCPCDLYHIKRAEFDHGRTRRCGASKSDADVVMFMTQDAVPADEFLVEKLVEAFSEEFERKYGTNGRDGKSLAQVAVAYARQLPNPDCHIVEQYTRQFNYPDQSRVKTKEDIPKLGIKTFFCSDVCAAYRRDIFEEQGGFESPVIFNEDMFFAAKVVEQGYAVAYAADARVIHSHNYTVSQQFHRNFDLAVSQKKHPEIFEKVSSEAEGMRLVKSTVKYLCKIGKPWLIFYFGMQCVGKYAGYWMGKHYEKLGRKLILKCTMNPEYWKAREETQE